MNHERIRQDLLAFLDQELPPDRRRILEVHLRECISCQNELEQWQKTSQRVFQPLLMGLSEPFVHRVMRRVRADYPQTTSLLHFMKWAYPAMVLSMGACVVSFGYARRPNPISMDSVLLGDSSNVASQWYSNPPTEDQLLSSAAHQP